MSEECCAPTVNLMILAGAGAHLGHCEKQGPGAQSGGRGAGETGRQGGGRRGKRQFRGGPPGWLRWQLLSLDLFIAALRPTDIINKALWG